MEIRQQMFNSKGAYLCYHHGRTLTIDARRCQGSTRSLSSNSTRVLSVRVLSIVEVGGDDSADAGLVSDAEDRGITVGQ